MDLLPKRTVYEVAERRPNGNTVVCKVKRVKCYIDGYVMDYQRPEGVMDMVIVPRDYAFCRHNGSYMVGKVAGNNSAAPVRVQVGDSIDADCPGEDLSMLARTHLMAQGYGTLYDKAIPWKWVIIGGIVLIIGIVVVMAVRAGGG